jgi:hypothetical protein
MSNQDKSMAPTPGGPDIPKREKFSWSNPTEPGELRWISKKKLHIDRAYQREVVSRHRVLEIAREWDWKLVGALSVAERDDGTLFVYDGQHRYEAALHRDDVQNLPCVVFATEGSKDEARAFIGTNMSARRVGSYDYHRAAVEAGEPISMTAELLLADVGYEPTSVSGTARTTKAVRTVHRMVEQNEDLAADVLQLAARIAAGEQISAELLRGLFYAASQEPAILNGSYGSKLVTLGQEAISAEMARKRAITGKGGQKIEAAALVELVNKGKRTRRLSVE